MAMVVIHGFWLLLCLSSCLLASANATADSKYLIAMPKALIRSERHFVFVQADLDRFAFSIVAIDPTKPLTRAAAPTQIIHRSRRVSFTIPFANYKRSSIKLKFLIHACPHSTTNSECAKKPGDLKFTNVTTLPVLQETLLLFADTSKPVYKSGELIQFRLLPLFVSSLRPSQGLGNLTYDRIQVVAPDKSIMAQWLNVSWSTAFASLSYRLSRDPVFGTWRVKAQIRSQWDEETVEVKKYVLPRFTVEVKPPSFLLVSSERIVFSVCGKYSTGLPMRGVVRATVCVRPRVQSRYRRKRPCIQVNGTLQGLHECISFNESTAPLQLRHTGYSYYNSMTFVNATVIEQGTNVSSSKAGFGGKLSTQLFTIEVNAPDMYRPGLPYYGSVKTVRPDGSPYPNGRARLQVTVGAQDYYRRRGGWGYDRSVLTDASGEARFVVPLPPPSQCEGQLRLNLRSEAGEEQPILTGSRNRYTRYSRRWRSGSRRLYLTNYEVTKMANRKVSASGVYLQLYPLDWMQQQTGRCQANNTMRLRLQANVPLHQKSFHVLVMSGGVVKGWIPVNASKSSSVPCTSADSESLGHYTCLRVEGQRKIVRCLRGWCGPNCVRGVCPAGCVKGTCLVPGVCWCQRGWSGLACNVCVRRRGCHHGYCYSGDDCRCYSGWHGRLCDRKSRWSYGRYRKLTPVKVLDIPESSGCAAGKEEIANIFERDIEIELGPIFAPLAHLALFMYSGEELRSPIVSTGIQGLNLRRCLSQAAPTSFRFDKTTVRPGERLTASVRTTGRRVLCALALRDVALDSFAASKGVTLDALAQEVSDVMRQVASGGNVDPYRMSYAERCKIRPGGYIPQNLNLKDARYDFNAAGLFVLTNAVSYKEECPMYPRYMDLEMDGAEVDMDMAMPQVVMAKKRGRGGGARRPAGGLMRKKVKPQASPMKKKKKKPKKVLKKQLKPRVRKLFPETWKFELLADPHASINLTAPDSMTTWRSCMYCVSSAGLGIAEPHKLLVFQPFFIQMALPYSLIRGEAVRIPVKVFSYLAACFEVTLTAKPTPQLQLLGFTRISMCLCAFEQKSQVFAVRPTVVGKVPFEVSAVAVDSSVCRKAGSGDPPLRAPVADAVRRVILVEPEGVPEQMTAGELVCPAGRPTNISMLVQLPSLAVVPQSARAYLSWSGDAISSSLDNLDRLVRLPYGCGEQNMISLVPSIYVLAYFTQAGIAQPKVAARARKFILFGYRRELNYRHPDGSFSAFGATNGAKGSTWLTAFVLKSFVAARQYVSLPTDVLEAALTFLTRRQDPKSGCFVERGKLFHTGMKGGAGGTADSLSLSVYVLGALLEAAREPALAKTLAPRSVERAVDCIGLASPSSAAQWASLSTYAVALRAYVLSRWQASSPVTRAYLERLRRRQVTRDGLRYWPMSVRSAAQPYERSWRRFTAADVETTGYGLLASLGEPRPDMSALISAVRWLINERNEVGGWYSTQDTVIGLQSLATAAALLSGSGKGGSLNLTIEGVEGAGSAPLTDRIEPSNRMVTRKRAARLGRVSIAVNGSGCAVLQTALLFNVADVGRKGPPFELWATVKSAPPACSSARVRICVWRRASVPASNMAIVRAKMASGWRLTSASRRRVAGSVSPSGLQRVEVDADGAVLLYYEQIDSARRCAELSLERLFVVDGLRPMLVQVYDYYQPEQAEEKAVRLDTGLCAPAAGPAPTDAAPSGGSCPQCPPRTIAPTAATTVTTTADSGSGNATAAANVSELARTACGAGLQLIGALRVGASTSADGGQPAMWELTTTVDGSVGLWRARVRLASPECACRLPAKALLVVPGRLWTEAGAEVVLTGAWSVLDASQLDVASAPGVSASCASVLSRVLPP